MERSGAGRHWVALIVFLVLSFAVAAVGLLATIPNIPGWYAEAVKPAWTPPNALFGPVWTVLYVLIAVSAWLVWRTGAPRRRPAMTAYGVQLGLNAVWTPIFFAGYPAFGPVALWVGLGVIVALDAAIVVEIVLSARRSRLAAWLLVPYLAWCLYATTLNAGLAALNS